MNMEIIAAVKKRMKEELLPRQMEKLEIVLHEVFQEQENKKEKPCKEIYQCKKRFRRTMATRAVDKGMPTEQVQVLLGHSKIDTTLRYANVQQANARHSHQKYIC